MDKKKIMLYGGILIVNVILAIICGKAYSEFKITRGFESDFSSYPFYFDVTVEKSNYTFDEKGIEIPLTITNFSNDLFNDFNTDYEITLDGNDHFSLTGDELKGQIAGKSQQTKSLTLKLSAKSSSLKSNEKMNIVVKSTSPYAKEIVIPITIRNGKNPYTIMEKLANDQDDEKFDFTSPDIKSGVFMHYETRNYEYPIYYYRGDVNNNAIYATYCWKIVRTTEYGGVKLVYSGEPKDGKCNDSHDYLGSEMYNQKLTINGVEYATPSQVGYMYDYSMPIETIVPSYLEDNGNKLKVGTIFGHDVKYDSTTKLYTLDDTITITDLNKVEDDIRGGGGSHGKGYHYTCLTTESSCSKVYYIYYDDYGDSTDEKATGLFGVALNDGLNVTEALNKMLSKSSNTKPSHAYTYLSDWFNGKGEDFSSSHNKLIDHLSELDDVHWCNDRTIAGYHGWDLSNDNHSYDNKYLHFAAYGRLVGDEGIPNSRPDMSCDDVNDAFTVSNTIGNGDLEYPIGLLTADEAVLAGATIKTPTANYLKMNASKQQFLMTPYYISDDHVRLFAIDKDGSLDNVYSSTAVAIRPAIAITADGMIASGDGTADNPYIIEF